MFGVRFDRRRDLDQLGIGAVGEVDDVDQGGTPVGESAGLVERDGADPACVLQVDATFDQNPPAGCAAETGHDGDRGGDHQRARAGQHEEHQRPVEPGLERPAAQDRWDGCDDNRHQEHDRRVHAGEPVDEPLRRGTFGLGCLDRGGDPVERAEPLRRGHGHFERTALVDRPGEHGVARLFGHRDRFTSDRCLVDG